MGGRKRTRELALPIIFGPKEWIFVQEKKALTPEGCGKRTVGGGLQNPFLGGVSLVRVSTPLFFPAPPWHSLREGALESLRPESCVPRGIRLASRYTGRVPIRSWCSDPLLIKVVGATRAGATRLRGSERKSASQRVSQRTSENL